MDKFLFVTKGCLWNKLGQGCVECNPTRAMMKWKWYFDWERERRENRLVREEIRERKRESRRHNWIRWVRREKYFLESMTWMPNGMPPLISPFAASFTLHLPVHLPVSSYSVSFSFLNASYFYCLLHILSNLLFKYVYTIIRVSLFSFYKMLISFRFIFPNNYFY